MTTVLEVKNLKAYYGQTQALHGVSFALEQGGITTLLGANGAGKTTTLRAICNMVRTEGEVIYQGRSIRSQPTESIVRLGFAHVPEGRGTFTMLTVDENLRIAAYTRSDKAGVKRDLDMVFEYFPRLRERIQQQAGTLSGNPVAMAAGLATLAALDEPGFYDRLFARTRDLADADHMPRLMRAMILYKQVLREIVRSLHPSVVVPVPPVPAAPADAQ